MKSKNNQAISPARINQLNTLLKKLNINPKDFLTNKAGSSLQIVNEALTHTSARAKYNHERLEFLGDAVLRLAASKFIDEKFPNMHVGERSALRAQLVSDNWLTNVGKEMQIEKLLIIGSNASRDSSALATLQAETTEALIGALYECFIDLKKINDWLYPYWERESDKVLKDPYRQNSKSALQEWSQSNGFDLPKYNTQELSQRHGNPQRFFSRVNLGNKLIGEGRGASRKEAEKEAAQLALQNINSPKNS